MSIETLWDDDAKTIIRFKRSPDWTFNDYQNSITVAEKMASDAGHKVHVIHDSSDATKIPPNAMINFRTGNQRIAKFADKVIIVGDNLFMEVLFDMFKATNINIAEHFTIVPTLEEAREILSQTPIDKATNTDQ